MVPSAFCLQPESGTFGLQPSTFSLNQTEGGQALRDHTKLRAFELADEVAVLVYRVTSSFPKEELYGLTSQLRRAGVSVPSNIVEGCARDSQADYLRFLYIAFGSLRELHYQLDLSRRLGFLNDQDSSLIEPVVIETEKVLNGLIQSLREKNR